MWITPIYFGIILWTACATAKDVRPRWRWLYVLFLLFFALSGFGAAYYHTGARSAVLFWLGMFFGVAAAMVWLLRRNATRVK